LVRVGEIGVMRTDDPWRGIWTGDLLIIDAIVKSTWLLCLRGGMLKSGLDYRVRAGLPLASR
jgi:hypothetical protein